MRLIFLGPPGAGKGTQAGKICRTYNLTQLSTGDILRAHKTAGTTLGKKAQEYMDHGNLVPDTLIVDMIKEEMGKHMMDSGYILDGFPRTVPQAESLDKLLDSLGEKLDVVLVLDVPDDELVSRLSARRTCKGCAKPYHLTFKPPQKDGVCDYCGGNLYQRDDDKEEPIRKRLQVYKKSTMPLIEYYKKKNLAVTINGVGEMNEIFARLRETLDKVG